MCDIEVDDDIDLTYESDVEDEDNGPQDEPKPPMDEPMDDEDTIDTDQVVASTSSASRRAKYDILNVDEIVKLMNQSIDEVMSVMELPNDVIRILLNHFNWDKTHLLEKYFDSNRDQLFTDTHIIDPKKAMSSVANTRKNSLCLICYNDMNGEEMASISCGHEFYCWRQYLTNKIIGEGVCNAISCAENGCDIIVDDNTIQKIIEDKHVLVKYQYLMTNSFVVSNRFLRWCPSPDCLSAIKVDNYVEFIPIECKCGSVFCFICGERWHEPTRCAVLKSWQKKCLGESGEKIDCETANWILSYTKECPKCKAPIEKNGGCNHMTCRNQQCKYEFCWICLSDWSKHGYQTSCNKFEESKETQTARARLQRYIHYWTRFHNHQQSLNCEKKQHSEVRLKMDGDNHSNHSNHLNHSNHSVKSSKSPEIVNHLQSTSVANNQESDGSLTQKKVGKLKKLLEKRGLVPNDCVYYLLSTILYDNNKNVKKSVKKIFKCVHNLVINRRHSFQSHKSKNKKKGDNHSNHSNHSFKSSKSPEIVNHLQSMSEDSVKLRITSHKNARKSTRNP
ncbi:unnamed protein product [Oppiella nova]|uniref:RBR-type E3 ubiquitin transferase n=1 Tax=Oppiella nova TaxID=334625 RepID=A0A7R9MFD6_9ACAR|nr:unnamed protein product [Oppiella nova]CAG2176376.1 unnamed protein product [Oppiella nova]